MSLSFQLRFTFANLRLRASGVTIVSGFAFFAFAGFAFAADPRDLDGCVSEVLSKNTAETEQRAPGLWTRTQYEFNFRRHVRGGDRASMRSLIDDSIVKPGSIEYVSQGMKDPRLTRPGLETVTLVSSQGDAVRVILSPALGDDRAFIERAGRVYLVELGINRAAGNDSGVLGIRFHIPTTSHYQEGVEWAVLTDHAKERLNEALASRRVAPDHFRVSGIEAVPLRVLMPTGHVFTQVEGPSVRTVTIEGQTYTLKPGLSMRDESTGRIWYPAIEEEMTLDQAKAACEALGGWLPTRPELESWVSHLGRTNHQLNDLFPQDNRIFWSAAGPQGDPRVAYVMKGKFGNIFDPFDATPKAVRCVR